MLQKLTNSLYIFLFFLLPTTTYAQEINSKKFKFTHLPSSNEVLCFLNDSRGFMWIGTFDGLNRYDGYQFKAYIKNDQAPNSLTSHHVNVLAEDSQSVIWIGTVGGGLYEYNSLQDNFIKHIEVGAEANIRSITQDDEGTLWIGTDTNPSTGACLFYYDKRTKKFIAFNKIQTQYGLNPILAAGKNELWLGVQRDGLWKINTRTGKVIKKYNKDSNSLSVNDVAVLSKTKSGKIWIGYYGSGIDMFDPENEQFTYYPYSQTDSSMAGSNTIRNIIEDSEGNVWVGSDRNIWIINPQTNKTYTLYRNKYDENTIKGKAISALYLDKLCRVWVGFEGKGISIWDKRRYKFDEITIRGNHYETGIVYEDSRKRFWCNISKGLTLVEGEKITFYGGNTTSAKWIGINSATCIKEDYLGQIWIGTWDSGMYLFNEKNQTFTKFTHDENDSTSLPFDRIFDICQEKNTNKLWVATLGRGVGIMDLTTKKFERLTHNAKNVNSLSNEYATKIFQDSQGNMWVGTERGLNKYVPEKKHFIRFEYKANDVNSLSNGYINSIFEDKEGTLWIGTNGGLNKMTPQGNFIHYTLNNGLPNEIIMGIEEDKKGNLWLLTHGGVVRFDKQKTFMLFDETSGLLSNKVKNHFKNKENRIYIGSQNGINIFHPDSIKDNPYKPPVYLTDFKIFNKSVKIGEHDSLLRQDISQTKEITLAHQYDVLSFDFVALNFTQSSKNQYAYMMEGFEKEWNYVGGQRSATYTSLPAGTYTFRVKASNNDGLWNEEGASIRITILPPWWETWWFRTVALTLFLSSGIIFYFVRINAVKKQNQRLEKTVAERTQELQFANHEVKAKNEALQTSEEELRQNMEELETNQELLKEQKQIIETAFENLNKQNQKVNDSIRYAQRIQNAILPHETILADAFSEHFVIFKPKDVVSGDFYWYIEVENRKFLAIVDCTGHGVPGAFMSMIGNTLLYEIINAKRIFEPNLILEALHMGILNSLNKKDAKIQDGMDVALCCIESGADNKVKVQFSGAKRPLYYFSKQELIEIQADRKSIGQALSSQTFYHLHEIELQIGDTLYMSTDGWIDSINPQRKRFGSHQFKEMLLQGANLSLKAQEEVFRHILEDYEQGTEQRDDVLLVGVKV